VGIPAEALPHLFDPFFTTKATGRGGGLGLSLCHGLVREAGGRIEVASTLGKGTTFRVVLPAGADQAAAGG
jgi:two-component system NtrC family sensor kinase